MARCKPFDEQIREALRKLEFAIADDGESAKFTDGITVEIYQPAALAADRTFLLTIELPNGLELDCKTRRDTLLDAAGIEPGEDAAA
jgi:hypothetical protein